MAGEKAPASAPQPPQSVLGSSQAVPQTTPLFRAMNFELFVKPVCDCVAYAMLSHIVSLCHHNESGLCLLAVCVYQCMSIGLYVHSGLLLRLGLTSESQSANYVVQNEKTTTLPYLPSGSY